MKRVAVIAPAGPPDRDKLESGIASLEKLGFDLTVMPNVYSKCGISYVSASTQDRINDLHAAWSDHTIDMIICARGGYGSVQLLPLIDWDLLRSRSLPFLGYSDITALHLAMLSQGVSSPISAPMVCEMSDALSFEMTKGSLFSTLNCDGLQPGRTNVAANLTVLCSLVGTAYMPNLAGMTLILEDIGEDVYKIDRMLTQLLLSGILSECREIHFGQFSGNDDPEQLELLFTRFSQQIGLPIQTNIKFGHSSETLCFKQGPTQMADKNL